MNSLSNQEKDFIKQLWCEGVPIPEIAERAEVAVGTVYRITLPLRDPNGRTVRAKTSICARARGRIGVWSEASKR